MKLKVCSFLYFAALVGVIQAYPSSSIDNDILGDAIDYRGILATYRIIGTSQCYIGGTLVKCIKIENAFPCGVFEVVRRRFATRLEDMKETMSDYAREFTKIYSSHTPASLPGSNLQFADVHVYTFVPMSELPVILSSPLPTQLTLNFLSELAGTYWKDGRNDSLMLGLRGILGWSDCESVTKKKSSVSGCAGSWGSYYPRIGYFSHSNQVRSAFVQALRAGRAANDGMLYPTSGYPFEPRTGHYIQLISPQRTGILTIGYSNIDKIMTSNDGYYLLMHYGIFRSCPPCKLIGELQPARR